MMKKLEEKKVKKVVEKIRLSHYTVCFDSSKYNSLVEVSLKARYKGQKNFYVWFFSKTSGSVMVSYNRDGSANVSKSQIRCLNRGNVYYHNIKKPVGVGKEVAFTIKRDKILSGDEVILQVDRIKENAQWKS